jgi:ribosomal protein L15
LPRGTSSHLELCCQLIDDGRDEKHCVSHPSRRQAVVSMTRRGHNELVKVLGTGELTVKVDLVVDAWSKSAQEKIEKAGGSVTTR